MLCITRRVDEKILIGDDIEILVIYLKNGHVKLGITAPAAVQVDREEKRRKQEAGNARNTEAL